MAKRNINKELALSLDRLKQLLHYCPETGEFTWLSGRSRTAKGSKAGSKHHSGYINIAIDRRLYLAHRLAIFYMTGEWPDIADHINRVRDDNRWSNLRSGDASENSCNKSMLSNNTSGYRCVFWNRRESKWHARIVKDGKGHSLGYFSYKNDAIEAVINNINKLHGEFKGEVSDV